MYTDHDSLKVYNLLQFKGREAAVYAVAAM